MQKKYLSALFLVSGIMLTACPPETGMTDTNTDTGETGTSTGGTTEVNTTPPGTTTENPPTTGSTTETPTTGDTTEGPGTTTGSTTEMTGTGSTTMVMPPLTLCDRLGGPGGITELLVGAEDNPTDGAIGLILVDDKVNGYFLNSDVDAGNLVACLEKQLGELAQCPGVVYDCQNMKDAHAGLGISTNDFTDFATDFAAALDAHQANHPDLTDDDKMAIMTALGGMAPDIVEDANNDITVYQRVGRKPAIRALVGKPGEAGSFADNVAMDVSINGYFGMTDFDRLNTCITRQVAGIDGPIKYGMEVNAPAPADPGVALDNPCKDMETSHMGLMDPNDMQVMGIDINDFVALVTDLVTAMNTFMVPMAEQDAILGALAPLCEPILAPMFKNQCPSAQKVETIEATMIAANIPDNGYNGMPMPPSMVCQDLVVPDDPINFVAGAEVTVGINHPWVGDLTIKLVSPDGKILTLVSRPGLNEAADDGNGAGGDSSNLAAANPITFKNGGANNPELMGGTIGANAVICKDENPPLMTCEWNPNPGKGPGMSFDDFIGDTAAGTWKLCVGDGGAGDQGQLESVKFVLNRVKYDPTP